MLQRGELVQSGGDQHRGSQEIRVLLKPAGGSHDGVHDGVESSEEGARDEPNCEEAGYDERLEAAAPGSSADGGSDVTKETCGRRKHHRDAHEQPAGEEQPEPGGLVQGGARLLVVLEEAGVRRGSPGQERQQGAQGERGHRSRHPYAMRSVDGVAEASTGGAATLRAEIERVDRQVDR